MQRRKIRRHLLLQLRRPGSPCFPADRRNPVFIHSHSRHCHRMCFGYADKAQRHLMRSIARCAQVRYSTVLDSRCRPGIIATEYHCLPIMHTRCTDCILKKKTHRGRSCRCDRLQQVHSRLLARCSNSEVIEGYICPSCSLLRAARKMRWMINSDHQIHG